MVVYKITNVVNHKVYIGQTIQKNPNDRFLSHFKAAKAGRKTAICHAIRKYGRESFKFEIIYKASNKVDLDIKEAYYIKQYNSTKIGYNMLPCSLTISVTEEDRELITLNLSISMKKYRQKTDCTRSKSIKCLTDGLIFRSAREASNYYKLSCSSVGKVARKERVKCFGMKFEYTTEPYTVRSLNV